MKQIIKTSLYVIGGLLLAGRVIADIFLSR